MPPKHDLRGGRASAACVAMSSSIFVPSTNRCPFAVGCHEIGIVAMARSVHEHPVVSVSLAVERASRF